MQNTKPHGDLPANVRVIHADDLKVLLAEAAEEGAKRALASVGLHDEEAADDVKDLRSLLEAWRDTKKTAWKTAVSTITKVLLGAIVVGLAIKFNPLR